MIPVAPPVTPASALGLTAVFRACSLLADAVSTSPPSIYVRQANGGRLEVLDTSAARSLSVLSQLDAEMWAFSCALYGQSYLEIVRDGTGAPFEFRAIPNWRVSIEVEQGSGRVWFRIAADQTVEEPARLLPERDMIVARYRATGSNRLTGVSPLTSCSPAFALALQSRVVQQTLFSNLTMPRGILQGPGRIEPELAKRMQAEWEENFSGSGLGKTAVLTNGLEYKDIAFKAIDAELLATIRATTADVARAYCIPLQFLDGETPQTFASAVEGTRALYSLTLRSFAARMADAIAQKVLTRNERANGATVEYDLTTLLLLPGTEQAEFLGKLANAGLATPNELRNRYLGLPDVEGGDVLRAPSNTVPLPRWAASDASVPSSSETGAGQ